MGLHRDYVGMKPGWYRFSITSYTGMMAGYVGLHEDDMGIIHGLGSDDIGIV